MTDAEIGRVRKNETTEVVVRKTEFKGSVGIDIQRVRHLREVHRLVQERPTDTYRPVEDVQRGPG